MIISDLVKRITLEREMRNTRVMQRKIEQKETNYGPKPLLCTCMAFPYTTREPEILHVNWKSIKLTWAEPIQNKRED